MSRNDENYEKPSRYKQWQEKSGSPIATRVMTKQEIEEFRHTLVASFGCDDEDITYDFRKIADVADEDRDDCLWLKYKMRCISESTGRPTYREVFNIKLPIPEDIRKMAEHMRKQQAIAKPLAILNAAVEADILPLPEVAEPIVDVVPVAVRPVLRKPTRGGKK